MKSIEIIVDPQGASRIETKGFQGGACQLASRILEEALGNRLHERLTQAYYETERQEQTNVAHT